MNYVFADEYSCLSHMCVLAGIDPECIPPQPRCDAVDYFPDSTQSLFSRLYAVSAFYSLHSPVFSDVPSAGRQRHPLRRSRFIGESLLRLPAPSNLRGFRGKGHCRLYPRGSLSVVAYYPFVFALPKAFEANTCYTFRDHVLMLYARTDIKRGDLITVEPRECVDSSSHSRRTVFPRSCFHCFHCLRGFIVESQLNAATSLR